MIPRVVRGREVLLDGVSTAEFQLDTAQEQVLDLFRFGSRAVVHQLLSPRVLGAGDVVGQLCREHLAKEIGECIAIGTRHHVRRRTLQHGDVRCGIGHRWHQRDGRCSGADHHHTLVGVVEVIGPFLWVHDSTGEALPPAELGQVSRLVGVVASAHEQVVALESTLRAIATCGVHHPCGRRRRPFGSHHALTESHVAFQVVLSHGLTQVFHDRWPVGDRFLRLPWFELVAERVHVAIGANPRVLEEIPRATDVLATLENHEAAIGGFLLQVDSCADAGDSCAYNDDVEAFSGHAATLRCDHRVCCGSLW